MIPIIFESKLRPELKVHLNSKLKCQARLASLSQKTALAGLFLLIAACDPKARIAKYDPPAPKLEKLEIESSCVLKVNSTVTRGADSKTLIRSDYNEGEITCLCDKFIATTEQKVSAIVQVPESARTIENTLLTLETALADLSDYTTPLTFMGYVSTQPKLREEGSACEEKVGQFRTGLSSRKDLFVAIKASVPRSDSEKRLLSETVKSFIKSGMNLDDAKLAQVKKLFNELNSLQAKFSLNLNNDITKLEFKAEELAGATPDFISRLTKNNAGNYIVTTKGPDYLQVMENVSVAQTRKKMLSAYENRQADANTTLLEQAISVRSQIAELMGYNTWAEYQLDGRMAKDVKTVLTFLNGLKEKLTERNREDLKKLFAAKKLQEPTATSLDAWDIRYYENQVKLKEFSVDEDLIKDFLPTKTVVEGLFKVYSQLLGVNYVLVNDAKTWNPDVQLYEIHSKVDNKLLGYFYADLVPREGKYGHAAAFPILSGRSLNVNNPALAGYSLPIAAIVANLTPPTDKKPSLLSHDDVETLFHEFGHIMHQTLTRAPYSSLSGSSVAQDFVEAPSQMLENWVWDADILSNLSGHYEHAEQKLPSDLIQKKLASRDFNKGYTYTRQLLFALFDMSIHSQKGPVNVTATYAALHQELVGLPDVEGSHFPASFGHMMGGYDAGYYSYLWSEVYAADMFTRFQNAKNKLLDPEVGGLYRKTVLESGNSEDAMDLLKKFLGREPNSEAFYKKLHISF